jgi:hypothetical protein
MGRNRVFPQVRPKPYNNGAKSSEAESRIVSGLLSTPLSGPVPHPEVSIVNAVNPIVPSTQRGQFIVATVTASEITCSVFGRMPLCSGKKECVAAYTT